VAGAAARTLSERDLNRALLARQLLLEQAHLTVPRALERIGGMQSQYAPSMYIGLWSRLEGFERDHLTRALERRTVVQGTLMRATIHLVSARDYWPLAVAIRRRRREWWLRAHSGAASAREMATLARRLRRQLGDGSLRRADIGRLLGRGSVGTNGVGLWLDLVRVPPSGTWERRRADLYAAADAWLDPPDMGLEEATEHLIRGYLRGFGPASQSEIADWAGLRVKDVAPALKRLRLRHFRTEGGEELLDLPRAPLPDPETPAPVRFLPTWDATLLTHARGSGILPEEFRRLVFNTKTPQSVGTFTVDGAVAGSWRHEGGHIRLSPFRRLPRAARGEAEEEAERLAAFQA
jgi:hypothetical protein